MVSAIRLLDGDQRRLLFLHNDVVDRRRRCRVDHDTVRPRSQLRTSFAQPSDVGDIARRIVDGVAKRRGQCQRLAEFFAVLRIEIDTAGRLRDLDQLIDLAEPLLAEQIRPSGYFNLKAKRLKNLLQLIKQEQPDGDLERFFALQTETLREKLLSAKGIGPETADSILLYGGEHPVFVVDAYTYRILSRHNLVPETTDYQSMQDLFMDNLVHDPVMFNQYHALIVRATKQFCKKRAPLCEHCPLEPLL